MKYSRIGAVSALLFLLGCEQSGPAEGQQSWVADSANLGPLHAEFAFDQAALAAALPGYDIAEETVYSEGMPYAVLIARPTGVSEPAFSMHYSGDMLGMVFIHSNSVVSNAFEIGDRVGGTPLASATCFPGMEDRSGDVVCQDPREPSLHYWINVDYAGPDGSLPPSEVISDGHIYEITWQPGH